MTRRGFRRKQARGGAPCPVQPRWLRQICKHEQLGRRI